jgi:hypothetical protein
MIAQPAGHSLAFEMQVPRAQELAPRRERPLLGLDPFGARAPQLHARVTDIDK